jgi:hypothetical protein
MERRYYGVPGLPLADEASVARCLPSRACLLAPDGPAQAGEADLDCDAGDIISGRLLYQTGEPLSRRFGCHGVTPFCVKCIIIL